MIHYQLQCSAAHGFDGWFRDSDTYEEQAAQGLVECPMCGERQVARALMAPAVPRKGGKAKAPKAPAPATGIVPGPPPTASPTPTASPVTVGGERMPDQVRAMLQKLRAEVERNCDYVGSDFADEARRIHDGQGQKRAIYGEATEAQAEALLDDGIEVGRIPWLPRSDA